jgi:hypothetical protein
VIVSDNNRASVERGQIHVLLDEARKLLEEMK